ncbi:MAG: 3-deoxy-manno-octulosonate cytidylyltransferase [Proteobacteria bacterium]|nr:3-deoxy-manno-octulosonate cytidylyltransferase [Pseudomonadota bacterium]
MKPIIIVPARMGSQRLPAKPLLRFEGKTMIRHTIDRILVSGLKPVIVATDSDEIFAECSGIEDVIPLMTKTEHSCGTERVLEAYQTISKQLGPFDIIINVQGDEPFVSPTMLKELIREMEQRLEQAEFWTTICDLPEHERDDQNVAKVVVDQKNNALIFTRDYLQSSFKHTSVYVYRPEFLEQFCSLPISPLEKQYRLEQMRALDNGFKLNCLYLPYDAVSINSIEDLEKAGVKDYQLYRS